MKIVIDEGQHFQCYQQQLSITKSLEDESNNIKQNISGGKLVQRTCTGYLP